MYRKIIFVIGILMAAVFGSCKKETTDNVSKIFKVPTIELIGPEAVSLSTGAAYTDQGATFFDEDGTTKVIQPSSNPINNTVPGLYLVKFSQKSKSEIYEAEAYRYVAITNVTDPTDYSGVYLRTATGVPAIVQKVAKGLYRVTNPGGAGVGVNIVVYFVQIDNTTWVCPTQPTVDGDFSVNTITFTSTGATWKVVNPGYGTALRTFVKQ